MDQDSLICCQVSGEREHTREAIEFLIPRTQNRGRCRIPN